MQLKIAAAVLKAIHKHGEAAYPEEGAGLMLGRVDGDEREVSDILPLENSREDAARHNRYLTTAQDMLAARRGLDIVGVFHSHPDHPNQASEFDREWALPFFSYIITSIQQGKAAGSRSWRLTDDRTQFAEERIQVIETVE